MRNISNEPANEPNNDSLLERFADMANQYLQRVAVSDTLGITIAPTMHRVEGDTYTRTEAMRLSRDIASANLANFKPKAEKLRKEGKSEAEIAAEALRVANGTPEPNPVYSLLDLGVDALVAEMRKHQGIGEGTAETRVKQVASMLVAAGSADKHPLATTSKGVVIPESFVALSYADHVTRLTNAMLAETFVPTKRGAGKATAEVAEAEF
jgi:hypothetical protein